MVASLLRSSATAGAHGGGSPATRSSPTAFSRPPLVSPRLQLWRRRATAVARVLGLSIPRAKIHVVGCTIYSGSCSEL
jgi:hypothetical protein